jgi:ATP-binding cassette subfamily B protein
MNFQPHPELAKKLKALLGPKEEVQVAFATDMDERMDFGESWLLATPLRVLVFAGADGAWRLRKELALKGVSSFEVGPLVGGGVLLAKTGKRSIELVRYSNSMTAHVSGMAKAMSRLAKKQPVLLPEEQVSARCPTCGRLKPERSERCPFCVSYVQAMKRILSYLLPYKARTAEAIFLTTLSSCLALIPPVLQKHLIDDALPGKDRHLLAWLTLTYLGANIAHTFVEIYNGRRLAWLGGRVGTDIRLGVFRAVERLSLIFFDKRSVGQVQSRVMHDSEQLQQFLIEGFPYLANQCLMLVIVLGILYLESPLLTLLIMIPVPILFVSQKLFWRLVRSLDHKSWNHYALLNTRLHEQVSGMKVVKAFSQEKRELTAFQRQNDRFFEAELTSQRFWKLFFPGMLFFITSGILIVWWIGGQMVMDQKLTIGVMVEFIAYLWMFYGPLQWFQQVSNWMTKAFVGAERIFEVMDSAPEAYDRPDAVAMPRVRGDIEFRNVSFSYERGSLAIKNLSFKIKAGELIGLVGRSGSGKSTMLALLCRFYAPDEGEILVDGVPIEKIRLEDLRHNLGLVLQEPFLFGTSIYDNLCYSRPGASMEEVIQAARAANAHDFVMGKPDAYDTRVGERGNRISGGEKQRLSIARAILHDPRVLIMDEATSSVDSETEFKIQQAMDRLSSGRTTLVAAHRLSTLRHADRIFVMEGGKLVEQGSHSQLMRNGGRYHRLVKVQEKMWRRAKRNLAIAGDGGGADEKKP